MDATHPKLTEADIEWLKAGLRRTYKERFQMATRLYKTQQTMNTAIITHKPFKANYFPIINYQPVPLHYQRYWYCGA